MDQSQEIIPGVRTCLVTISNHRIGGQGSGRELAEWERSDDASTGAKSGRRLDHRRDSIPDCRLGVVEGGRRVRSASDEDV